MTEKLYYTDGHCREFSACVTHTAVTDRGVWVTLDKTALFPGGGGQEADSGTLDGMKVMVAEERDEDISYLLPELPKGETVRGEVDWSTRFPLMQSHSGEHIVSGLVHGRYGYENVGFHMGADGMVVDFSGFLDEAQLAEIETLANAVVVRDLPIETLLPTPEELKTLNYRSKKELSGQVRLVKIGDIDLCACCAPHVLRTGEIGLIKIVDSIRHKDGVRITLLAGQAALARANLCFSEMKKAGALLSAKPEKVADSVQRLLDENGKLHYAISQMGKKLAAMEAKNLPETDGNLCLFTELDGENMRLLTNAGMEKCTGLCGVFSGTDGNYRYVIGSLHRDMQAVAKELNRAISGRGGGRGDMIQGSCTAARADIEAYFREEN